MTHGTHVLKEMQKPWGWDGITCSLWLPPVSPVWNGPWR